MRALGSLTAIPVSKDGTKITLARMLVRPEDNAQFPRFVCWIPTSDSEFREVKVVVAMLLQSEVRPLRSLPRLLDRIRGQSLAEPSFLILEREMKMRTQNCISGGNGGINCTHIWYVSGECFPSSSVLIENIGTRAFFFQALPSLLSHLRHNSTN